jgi:hypothetical protein
MNATTLSPIAARFAWKEYRTLRGLWLAVLVLGVLVQLVSTFLAAPDADVPLLTFAAAWGTTVLYAIGAAAILFAVEHEDETYSFLAGLPTRWLPLYLGKLCIAAASAIAAAVVLMIAGWIVAGGHWPTATAMGEILGLLGFGVIEAIAWGTLFSLLVKRPLVAVLWTIVVGALAVHWAVNSSSVSGAASLELSSYSEAIPRRLAIVAVVFACCTLLARRWLASGRLRFAPRSTPTAPGSAGGFFPVAAINWRASHATNKASATTEAAPTSRSSMLARLFWQTWRDSWKMLLLPFVVAALLYAGIVMIGGFVVGAGFAPVLGMAIAFFLPSLYGAMTFGADQRRASYRFLAEHAARPRYVWLTRILVWLGSLVAIAVALRFAATVITTIVFEHAGDRAVDSEFWRRQSTRVFVGNLYQLTRSLAIGSFVAGFGALAAYAIGQLCSMLLRSEILAAFLAIILSVVLGAWVAVVVVWHLNVWAFLLPLFVGTMFATWLRAPDWIVGRNSWKAWWKPALAVAVPIVFVGLYLPIAREIPAKAYQDVAGWLPTEVYKSMAGETPSGDTPEARKTASLYEQADHSIFAGQDDDPFARWRKSQYESESKFGDIDGAKIPSDELVDFLQAKVVQRSLDVQAWRDAAKAMIDASRRPTCWFDVDWSSTPVPTRFDPRYNEREEAWTKIHSNFHRVLNLPLDTPTRHMTPVEAAEFQLASVRMLGHLRQGQPTAVTIRTLSVERQVLQQFVDWAAGKGTPTAQIRTVLDQLQQYFESAPLDATAPFAADDRIVRGVLRGKTQPLILAETPIDISRYLAFLANELPWERRRALAALTMITMQNFRDAEQLKKLVDGREDPFYQARLQVWIQQDPYRVDLATDAWVSEQPSAATSYLARFEYLARVPVLELFEQVLETEAARRATIVRLALLLYRRDHDKYPAALSDLVPDYLREVAKDPFTGNFQTLSYALRGRDSSLAPFRNYFSDFQDELPLVWSVGVEHALINGPGQLDGSRSLIFPLPR